MTATSPAQIVKGALRRLAAAKQEPTPENYARAYAEECGQPPPGLPDRARPLLERLVARMPDEPARRDELVSALMQARWDLVSQALDRSAQTATGQTQAWAATIERLVRTLQRSTRQWSAGRKKESLQRVLDGSRSDMQRLHQRLGALVGAWEADAPTAPTDVEGTETPADPQTAAAAGPGPEPDALAAAHPDSTPSSSPVEPMAPTPDMPLASGSDPLEPEPARWDAALGPLRLTINAGLPEGEQRAAELADRLAGLADRLASEGPSADCLLDLEGTCSEIRRLFAHRHHLIEQLGQLCTELGQGLAELAEDESWAQGQAQTLHARLAGGLNSRSVRAASEVLADTRARQARVRTERNDARNALKQLIHRLLEEIGELEQHTGRFQHNVGRHVQAIEAAETIESLAGVVRELLDDSRAVQDLVHQAQDRMASEHARARQLEDQVRSLEGELRKLSDEVCTDALTQVANRRGLMQAFSTECARREREGATAPLAVALLDIDNFKKLNDSLGHAAGDRALQVLSAAVRDRLRPVDHLARFGGEEFVVLLPATALVDAQQALTRLQRALSAALFMHDDQEVFVTFSAGVTEWRPGEPLETALERADEALYEAKRTGKNRTCTA